MTITSRRIAWWSLHAMSIVIAAAGCWLLWSAVDFLWVAIPLFRPLPAGQGLGSAIGMVMGTFFLLPGMLFGAAGVVVLGIAWWMSSVPSPARLIGTLRSARRSRRHAYRQEE